MRMRKKKHGEARLAACAPILVHTKEEIAALGTPIQLEIGCGKGAFITELAARNPDVQYVAIERVSDVLLLAAERTMALGLKNIRFYVANAKTLTEDFAPGSVSRIYLNFSDPWPKAGHAARRLTHANFLSLYHTILAPDGQICFKTDNAGLFSFSLAEFELCGWELSEITDDLHNSVYAADNIQTEYEKNFSQKGFSIHRLVARRPDVMTMPPKKRAAAPEEASEAQTAPSTTNKTEV